MANEVNFAAIPQTAIRVITKPAAFFREMPKAGGYIEPLVFALVLGCLAGIIGSAAAQGKNSGRFKTAQGFFPRIQELVGKAGFQAAGYVVDGIRHIKWVFCPDYPVGEFGFYSFKAHVV